MKQKLLLSCALTLIIFACNTATGGGNDNNLTSEVDADSSDEQIDIANTQSALATRDAIPTNTPTITLTPVPSATPTPTLIPAVVNLRRGYSIQTLCFDVSLEYPQFDYDLEVPVEELTSQYLNYMGFDLVQLGADCDAVLTILLTISSRSNRYTDSQTNESMTCFAGSGAEGVMRLEAPDMTGYEITLSNSYTQGGVFGCITEPDPNVNFEKTWLPEVITGLVKIWGISAAVATFQSSGDLSDSFAQASALENYQRYDEDLIILMPYLLPIVENGGNPTVIASLDSVLDILEDLGEDAIPAVPFLIQGMENELASSSQISGEWYYARTLEEITGRGADIDPDIWWDWWESNKP